VQPCAALYGVERTFMVHLLRTVKTCSSYSQIREHLHSHEPDDVWYDPDVGWLVAFALRNPAMEQLVVFVLHQPEEERGAVLARVLEVSHDREGVNVRLLAGLDHRISCAERRR